MLCVCVSAVMRLSVYFPVLLVYIFVRMTSKKQQYLEIVLDLASYG